MKKFFMGRKFYLLLTIFYAFLSIKELISAFYNEYNFELSSSFLLISALSYQIYVYKKGKDNE